MAEIKDEKKHFAKEAEEAYRKYFDNNDAYVPETDAILQHCARSQNAFFLVFRLESAAEQLLRIGIARKTIPSHIREEMGHLLALARPLDIPLIKLQVLLVEFFLEPGMEKYKAFKSAFFENQEHIGCLQSSLFRQLVNTLSFFRFEGDSAKEYFSLYKFGMENNLLLENDQIHFLYFINIAIFAHVLEENKFLKQFIKKYGNKVEGERERINAMALAECYLWFGIGKYQLVLDTLPRIKNITKGFTKKRQILEFKTMYMATKNKYDAYVEIEEKKRRFWALVRRHEKPGLPSTLESQRCRKFIAMLCKVAKNKHNKRTKERLLMELEKNKKIISEYNWLKKIITGI